MRGAGPYFSYFRVDRPGASSLRESPNVNQHSSGLPASRPMLCRCPEPASSRSRWSSSRPKPCERTLAVTLAAGSRRSATPRPRHTPSPRRRGIAAPEVFSRSCATGYQRHPAPGKAAPGDVVQAADSRLRSLQPRARRGADKIRQIGIAHVIVRPRAKLTTECALYKLSPKHCNSKTAWKRLMSRGVIRAARE